MMVVNSKHIKRRHSNRGNHSSKRLLYQQVTFIWNFCDFYQHQLLYFYSRYAAKTCTWFDNNFLHCVVTQCWNEAFWFDVSRHVTSFNWLECSISVWNYSSPLKFVHNINSHIESVHLHGCKKDYRTLIFSNFIQSKMILKSLATIFLVISTVESGLVEQVLDQVQEEVQGLRFSSRQIPGHDHFVNLEK